MGSTKKKERDTTLFDDVDSFANKNRIARSNNLDTYEYKGTSSYDYDNYDTGFEKGSLFDLAAKRIESGSTAQRDQNVAMNRQYATMSSADRYAYDNAMANGKYLSPYTASGRSGKSDLTYNNAEWNALSKEQKEHYFDLAENKINEYAPDEEDRDYWEEMQRRNDWFTTEEEDEARAREYEARKNSTDNAMTDYARKILSGDKSVYDYDAEVGYMWNYLPDEVKSYLSRGILGHNRYNDNSMTAEDVDWYLAKNFSEEEQKILRDYGSKLGNAQRMQEEWEDEERKLEEMGPAAAALYSTARRFIGEGAKVAAAPVSAYNAIRGVDDPYATGIQRYARMGDFIGADIAENAGSYELASIPTPFGKKTITAGDVYQQSYSIGQNVLRMGVAGLGGTALSSIPGLNIGAEAASKALNIALTSGGVFQDTYTQALEQGADTGTAILMAIGHAFTESLFEEISVDKLGYFSEAPVIANKKDLVKAFLKSMFVEGSEEFMTEFANQYLDRFIAYDYSDYKAFKDAYDAKMGVETTDREAWGAFMPTLALKAGEAFLGGALSGLVLGVGNMGGAYLRGQDLINASTTISDNEYKRFAPIVENYAGMFNRVRDEFSEATAAGEETRKGYVASILNAVNKDIRDNISYAANTHELHSVMESALLETNGAISEETFNAYNAKLVELGQKATAEYKTYVENLNKGKDTTFTDLVYGRGDNAISRNIVEASKSIAEAQTNADLTESEREKTITSLTQKVDENVKKAEELVARYAKMGKELDSPEIRQFENVLGLENMAQMVSAAKKANELEQNGTKQLAKQAGKIYQIEQNSAIAKRVFKDKVGHVQPIAYDDIKNTTEFALAKVLSGMSGVNVAFYTSDRKEIQNGAYDPVTNTILIDRKAGKTADLYAIGETMSHEFTHWLIRNNAAAFDTLKEFVRNELGEEEFNKQITKHIENSKDESGKAQLDQAGAEEEIIAEACQRWLEHSEEFQKYAASDPEGAKTFIQRLIDFIRRLRDAFKGSLNNEVTGMVKDLDGLAKKLDALLTETLSNQAAEMSQEAAEGILENDPSVAEEIIGTEIVDEDSVKSSQRLNDELMEKDTKYLNSTDKETGKTIAQLRGISPMMWNRAVGQLKGVARRMLTDLAPYLPEDIPGKVEVGNASYGGKSMENTLVCIRSIINNDFTDMVSEELGRPLTVEEQLVASQILQIVNQRPECNYCYVATDRRAYRASFGTYFSQYKSVYDKVAANRAAFKNDLVGSEKRMEEVNVSAGEKSLGKGVIAKAYAEFLDGRKNTPDMRKRFSAWVKSAVNGNMPISQKDLTSARVRNKARQDGSKKWFIDDAEKYAQSATWAKKTSRTFKINGEKYVLDYVSYNGSILKWSQKVIDDLNSEFGLRMYSFSDYVPAFLLENMQMIMDASLRGLKVLAYTKDCGFAEAFADTGAGINISLFGTLDSRANNDAELTELRNKYKETNSDADRKTYLSALDKYVVRDGIGGKDGMMGANWDRASSLRKAYDNVGTVFVATNDDLVEWALANPDIDVVIPYHLVRTGEEVASFFNYKNYKAAQEDKKIKGEWATGNLKAVPPTVHKNNFDLYTNALKENNLTARFPEFIENPNYMKLVNETRMSYEDLQPVKPVFNQSIIDQELRRIKDEGQYGLMPGFKTKAEQDAFIENQNLVGQAVDAIGEWNESGKKPIDDTKYSSRDQVSIGMSEKDREKILRKTSIIYNDDLSGIDESVKDNINKIDNLVKGGFYKNIARSQNRDVIESELKKICKECGVFGKFRNDALGFVVEISNETINESVSLGIRDVENYIKMLPRLSIIIKNAKGLYAHKNHYYKDFTNNEFDNLIGGFSDGEYFYAVRIGVKRPSGRNGSVHFVTMSKGIKIDKGFEESSSSQKSVGTLSSALSAYNIADIFGVVNEEKMLEFAPDAFIESNPSQMEAKANAIKKTEIRTAKTNNKDFNTFMLKKNFDGARLMLIKSAEDHDFVVNKDKKVARLKSNPNIIRSIDPMYYAQNKNAIAFSDIFSVTEEELNASRKSDKGNKNGGNKKNKGEGTRFSLRDSEGNELTEAQQEYFKDSKIRDAEGNLKTMFHGTEADFNIFDFSQGGKNGTAEGFGIYLTDNEEVAKAYGGRIIKSYANVTKPAMFNKKTITSAQLTRLIETTAKNQAQSMIEEEGYGTLEDALKDTWISNYTYTYDKSLAASYREVANSIIRMSDNDRDIIQEVMAGMAIRDYDKAVEFYDVLQDVLGFDGFVTEWKNKTTGEKSEIVLAFNSNQIKNIDNLNPTESDDIRYSERNAESESEVIVKFLQSSPNALEALGAKDSVVAYAKEYKELKAMEEEASTLNKRLKNKKSLAAEERQDIMKRLVKLDRAIVNKTTKLTDMRTSRVLRDVLEYESRERESEKRQARAEGKAIANERNEINHRKDSITRKAKALMKMITSPTEKKHIPSVMVKPIAEMLDSIDFWSVAEGKKPTKKSASLYETFSRFKQAYEDVANDVEKGAEDIRELFDPDFLEYVNELTKYVSDNSVESINDMSLEQIKNLDQLLTELNHVINIGNKMMTQSRFKTTDELRDATVQELNGWKGLKEDKSDAKGSFLRQVNAGMADAYAWGEYAGSGAKEIVRMLSKAYNRKTNLIRQATDFTMRVLDPVRKDIDKWQKTEEEFKLASGQKVKMTIADMIDLYELSKREQALGHVLSGDGVGGIQVKNAKGKYTEIKRITSADLEKIFAYLRRVPRAIEVGDKLQNFLATTVADWGNKASNQMYGIMKFTDKNYWPIRSTSTGRKDEGASSDFSGNVDMNKIKNLGATKAVVKNANNAVYVENFLDVFSKHVDELSSYSELLPAITDAMRWWNSRTDSEGNRDDRVKDLLARKIGTAMAGNFKDIIVGLNGGVKAQDSLNRYISAIRGKVKAAAIALNPRVVVQQPFSYTRAAAVIEAKYLQHAMRMIPAVKEAQEHSAIAWLKHQGFHSSGIGPSMKKLVTGEGTLAEKITEKTMAPAGFADDVTWGTLWNAAKLKVEDKQKNLKKGSREYWDAIEDIFDEIINRTQVVETPLTQSPWMKSNMGSIYMAFMNEPVKTYSMVMTAFDKLKRNPKNPEARRNFARAVTTFTISGFALALSQSLIDAARDDDKEKNYWEKYLEKYLGNSLENLNPMTYLPLVKDAWSTIQGFSSNDLTSQSVNNIINAVREAKLLARGESKYTLWGSGEIFAKALSYATGIPVSNAMRIFTSMGNLMGIDTFRRKNYTKSELGRNVILELRDGNHEAADKYWNQLVKEVGEDEIDKAYGYLSDYLSKHDDDVDAFAVEFLDDATKLERQAAELMRKYDSEYITLDVATDSIRKAARDDQKEEAKAAGEKYKQTISSTSAGGTIYNSSDINRALEANDVKEAQILIDAINAGYAETDSNSTAKTLVTNYWKPKYLAAKGAERDRIAKMLYKLRNKGKQMFSASDLQKWVKDAQKKK